MIQNSQSGELHVIYGPMFSGKTTTLLATFERWLIAKKKCLLVTSVLDSRYSKEQVVVTHNNVQYEAVKLDRLADLDEEQQNENQIFAIDEGQFFTDLIEGCTKLLEKGKIIIVAALDATFEMKPFGRVCELVPMAETVKKLHAVCADCYGEASFTMRKTSDKEVQLVGGADIYKPVCRRCYYLSNRSDQLKEATTSTGSAKKLDSSSDLRPGYYTSKIPQQLRMNKNVAFESDKDVKGQDYSSSKLENEEEDRHGSTSKVEDEEGRYVGTNKLFSFQNRDGIASGIKISPERKKTYTTLDVDELASYELKTALDPKEKHSEYGKKVKASQQALDARIASLSKKYQ